MMCITQRCSKHFSLHAMDRTTGCNSTDQFNTTEGVIITTSNKRRQIGCTCLHCHHCLCNREDKSHVSLDTHSSQSLTNKQTIWSAGEFDSGSSAKLLSKANTIIIHLTHGANNFHADIRHANINHLLIYFLRITTRLTNQRGVGSNTINKSSRKIFTDFFSICGVKEDLHLSPRE